MLMPLIRLIGAKGYVCMPWIILHAIVRCHFSYAQKPCHMHEDLSWYCLSLIKVTRMIYGGNDSCRPVDAQISRLMRAGLWWCYMSLVDVARPLCAGQNCFQWVDTHTPRHMRTVLGCLSVVGWCSFFDAHITLLMSIRECTQTMIYFKMMCLLHRWCLHSLVETACYWLTCLPDLNIPRVWILGLADAAYRPWLMLHAIGQHSLPDMHIAHRCV